jgi:hypothetical protein
MKELGLDQENSNSKPQETTEDKTETVENELEKLSVKESSKEEK